MNIYYKINTRKSLTTESVVDSYIGSGTVNDSGSDTGSE